MESNVYMRFRGALEFSDFGPKPVTYMDFYKFSLAVCLWAFFMYALGGWFLIKNSTPGATLANDKNIGKVAPTHGYAVGFPFEVYVSKHNPQAHAGKAVSRRRVPASESLTAQELLDPNAVQDESELQPSDDYPMMYDLEEQLER